MSQNIKDLISRVNKSEIASIKSVVSGIIRVINDPKSTANDLIKVVELDPPLMGKVLKVANSAFYSPTNQIADLKHAIVWIGLDTLKELALSQTVCDIFSGNQELCGYSRNALWKHCVVVAKLCKMIYRKEFGEKGTEAYVAGLLHDIGIIVEDHFLSTEFEAILKAVDMDKGGLPNQEKAVLGFNHARLGKVLTRNWGLPQALSGAIGYHHNPVAAGEDSVRLASTICISECLSLQLNIDYSDAILQENERYDASLDILGIKPPALELIVEDARKELDIMQKQGLF